MPCEHGGADFVGKALSISLRSRLSTNLLMGTSPQMILAFATTSGSNDSV
jgi:hypothetical protein